MTLTDEAGQALNAILMAAESVNRQVEEIAAAAQTMDASANELVGAMDSVSAVVEENTAATEEMAASSGQVSQTIETIVSIAEENSAAAEEVSAAVEEVTAQTEEVTASAQSLSAMAQELQALVAQFKLPGTGPVPLVLSPKPWVLEHLSCTAKYRAPGSRRLRATSTGRWGRRGAVGNSPCDDCRCL